jgi:hypothetical protein
VWCHAATVKLPQIHLSRCFGRHDGEFVQAINLSTTAVWVNQGQEYWGWRPWGINAKSSCANFQLYPEQNKATTQHPVRNQLTYHPCHASGEEKRIHDIAPWHRGDCDERRPTDPHLVRPRSFVGAARRGPWALAPLLSVCYNNLDAGYCIIAPAGSWKLVWSLEGQERVQVDLSELSHHRISKPSCSSSVSQAGVTGPLHPYN